MQDQAQEGRNAEVKDTTKVSNMDTSTARVKASKDPEEGRHKLEVSLGNVEGSKDKSSYGGSKKDTTTGQYGNNVTTRSTQ